MMLKEIIKTKKKLNLMELIQYLEVFPFKYIKIYLAEDDTVKKENIISLNEDLKDSHFILEYSYEFVEIAFSKILSLIPSNTLIDMKNLTGSGIGSLLENKIKRNLEENGFIIKYFWNFTSKSDTIKKNEKDYVYDYNTYKKIKFLYDNEIEGNIELDYNKPYYIVLGNKDVSKSHNLDKKTYMKTVKKYNRSHPSATNFVFKKGQIIFLVADGSKELIPTANGYYNKETMDWIDKKRWEFLFVRLDRQKSNKICKI